MFSALAIPSPKLLKSPRSIPTPRSIPKLFQWRKEEPPEVPDYIDASEVTPESEGTSQSPRSLRTLCSLFVRKGAPPRVLSKNPSLLCSRVPYGERAQKFKLEILERIPGLALLPPRSENNGSGYNMLRGGINSLRAEVLDMNMIVAAMKTHRLELTHDVIASFFTWFSRLASYIDRYMFLEEDVIFNWLNEIGLRLRGDMRPALRMQLRGRLQKAFHDVLDCEDRFRPNIPAGETFGFLADHVDEVTKLCVTYTEKLMGELAPLIDTNCRRGEIDRIRCRIIRYIMNLEDAEDAIVMYTRWMAPRDLMLWKCKYLVRVERIYTSFKSWEEVMYKEHFEIAAKFADALYEENSEHQMTIEAEEWMETYCRAQIGMAKYETPRNKQKDESFSAQPSGPQ